MTGSGIPVDCIVCGAELLNPLELTGLCRECKLIARNERRHWVRAADSGYCARRHDSFHIAGSSGR